MISYLGLWPCLLINESLLLLLLLPLLLLFAALKSLWLTTSDGGSVAMVPLVPNSILFTISVMPMPLRRLSRCFSDCIRSISSSSLISMGFHVSMGVCGVDGNATGCFVRPGEFFFQVKNRHNKSQWVYLAETTKNIVSIIIFCKEVCFLCSHLIANIKRCEVNM